MNIEEQKKLIAACKNHDRKAMEKIYSFYISRMLAISLRYCKNRADAEDIVQESFIKVFKGLQNYTHKGMLGSWIERIVINCAIDYWHKMKKTVNPAHLELLTETESQEMSYEENLSYERALSPEVLRKFISELPEQYRYVLNLYAIEGYSHKEIGELLEIKESTSRSNYTRARKKLIETIRNSGMTIPSS